MAKRRGKGQIQLSFGIIFSIIIIIATIVVAFYVIGYFLDLSKCTKVGLFYDGLKKDVDKAWRADITQGIYKNELPSGIKKVCFGNSSQQYAKEDEEQFAYFSSRSVAGMNGLFYPPEKACDSELAFFKVEHAVTDKFFCVPVASGTAKVKLSKGSADALVKLDRVE
jgi:hypothetical protein